MKRLTEYSDLAGVRIGDLKSGVDERKAFDRLAAYEDTGLEPEEVVDMQRSWDMYGGEEGITAMLAQPPNDPLTLEELREMDGEPVFVNLDSGYWGIVDRERSVVAMPGHGVLPFAVSGGRCYRHKPEEGTK